jgi:hypothetical protein
MAYIFGGGEGTPVSIVSNGADYILNFCRSSPACYESLNIVCDFHPSTSWQDAYKSIQGCRIAPHTPRYCRRLIRYGFTDKAGLSLAAHTARQLFWIEPLSESILVTASPSAVSDLTFPLLHAHRQAYSFSSFIMRQLPQSFGSDGPR